ncbi:NTP transferase domain-containing protein [Isoptericola sp. NEAU-Y5]|uniref:Phosphoenolpyruvate guanylyltransferase n=1 Tax=Isoptericola luteus TaxID=2879484 RepID=A0ABS7ZL90_9MICO|nr:NTP transferase domain-containing protein [Isoptericola sp. NEAU-Y5]MCA5894414.1 NTP transferase domain-containing protein [Isoptericola sp. NEAU-Y5]
MGGTVAVVPLRDGVSGKSRLATALAPPARRRLVAALARHVVGVLGAAPGVDRVVVVTADVPFTTEALGLDGDQVGSTGSERQSGLPTRSRTADLIGPVAVVAQPRERPGLDGAVDVGRERAVALGAARVLVAHADLPLLSPDDVAAVLAAASPPDRRGGPGSERQPGPPTRSRTADLTPVVVATDRHGSGTNLLLVPAVSPFRFRFGTGSRAAHLAEAARVGLPGVVVRRPGTAADLDTIDDWGELPPAARSWLDGVTGRAPA